MSSEPAKIYIWSLSQYAASFITTLVITIIFLKYSVVLHADTKGSKKGLSEKLWTVTSVLISTYHLNALLIVIVLFYSF